MFFLSLLGLQRRNSQKHRGRQALKCQSVPRPQRLPQDQPGPSPNTARPLGVREMTSGAVMECPLENPRPTTVTECTAVAAACGLPNNRQVSELVWPRRDQGRED